MRRHIGRGERIGCEQESSEHVDVVAHDKLLRQTLRHIGSGTAHVATDKLDLLARNRVAVLLNVSLDAVVELNAGVSELAGKDIDQADLHRLLGVRRNTAQKQHGEEGECNKQLGHRDPPAMVAIVARMSEAISGVILSRMSPVFAKASTGNSSEVALAKAAS